MKTCRIGICLTLFFITTFCFSYAAEPVNHWEPILQTPVPRMGLVERPDNVVGFLNEHFGVMVGDWGESRVTYDGGKTWNKTLSNFQTHRHGLEIVNQNLIWSCGNTGNIFFSDNGAMEWHLAGSFGGSIVDSCKHLCFIDSNTGRIASYSKLGMTTDGGHHWIEIPLPSKFKGIAAIALQDETTGYLMSIEGNGYLYITHNRGQSWSCRRIGIKKRSYPVSGIAIRPTAVMRFSKAGDGLIIINTSEGLWDLVTSDGGITWRQGPAPKTNGSLFMGPDGKILTVCDFNNMITIFKRKSIF